MFVHEAHQAIEVPRAVKSHCYAWMVQAMNGDKPQGGSGQLPPGIDDDDNQIRQHWANLQGTSRITAMETFIKTVENMTTTYGLHSALAEETEADCYACNSAKYKSDFSDYRPDWLPEFHELRLLRKEKERLKRETHFLKLSSKMATTNKQQDDELVDSLEEEEEEDAEEAKRLHHQQQEEHRLPNEPVDLRVAAIKLEGGRGHHGYNGGDHTINWSRNDDNDENEKNEKGIDEINCSGKRQQQKKFQTSTPTAPPSSSSSIDNFYQDHAID
mmetsp:Transcript_36514/g.59174  ORF Transcript_36514/g.59174 Transcript_36514/m.59174 type:complete len:272 (+) Transcript_36514:168-983(+)